MENKMEYIEKHLSPSDLLDIRDSALGYAI